MFVPQISCYLPTSYHARRKIFRANKREVNRSVNKPQLQSCGPSKKNLPPLAYCQDLSKPSYMSKVAALIVDKHHQGIVSQKSFLYREKVKRSITPAPTEEVLKEKLNLITVSRCPSFRIAKPNDRSVSLKTDPTNPKENLVKFTETVYVSDDEDDFIHISPRYYNIHN